MRSTLGSKGWRSLTALSLCGILALGVWAGSRLFADAGGTGGLPIAGTIHVTVVEDGTDDGTGNPLPVPGAFVMVGLEAGDPFPGNFGFAGTDGRITFTDPSLSGMQTVTAGAEGYQYFSFVDVDASEIVIPLKSRYPVSASSVTGGLTGFPGVNNDGKVQLGLALQTLRIEDLTTGLDIQGMLSPEVAVNFPLVGSQCLPGNVIIPTQWELLFFKLEKTQYQLVLPTGTTQHIFCFGAEIGLTELIDLLEGEDLDMGALLGALTPLKAGVRRNVYVSGNLTGQTINMGASLNLNYTLNVANMPGGVDVLLASLGEINGDAWAAPGGGDLLLLGIKSVAGPAGSAVVSSAPATGDLYDLRYVVGAIAADVGDTSSGITGLLDRSDWLPGSSVTLDTPFLQIELDPVAGNLFSFSDATQTGISPLPDLNIATLSLTTTVPADPAGCGYEAGDTVDVVENLWTLVSPGETLAFYLPILPPAAPDILPMTEETPADDQLVWSHTVAGLTLEPVFDFHAFDMGSIADTLTHFSFNKREFSVDSDGDGVHLFEDNCPFVHNPDQADTNGNGIGDACDPSMGCLEDADCDDGDVCNGMETCVAGVCHDGTPLLCDDGDVCNGIETCHPVLGCQAGIPLACDDGVFCNGVEGCDPVLGCRPGTPPECDDGVFCNGEEYCDEALDRCVSTGNPCNDPNDCTLDICHEGSMTCQYDCNAAGWQDPCCEDDACLGAPICQEPPPGCFVATASFGTEMAGKIDILRQFRDQVLLAGPAGQDLVKAYYRTSPPLADFIQTRPALRSLVRVLLLPAVGLASLLL